MALTNVDVHMVFMVSTVKLVATKGQFVKNHASLESVCQQAIVAVMKAGLESFVIDVLESHAKGKY